MTTHGHSRRAILAALILTVGGSMAQGSAGPVSLGDDLRVEPLADGVWLYRATHPLDGHPVESNGLVINGDEGAIVIDTPWTDALTARLLDWAESSFGAVTAVVATHSHPDRLGGIAEVHRRGIASHGHVETGRLAVAAGHPTPGSTFTTELRLQTGSRIVEVFFPGPGHSPDNTVVWLPEHRLLFGGCLLKSAQSRSLGYVGDAVIERWPATLDTLGARYPEARVVVPGHGAVGGPELIRRTRELLAAHDVAPAAAPVSRRYRGVSWVAQPHPVERVLASWFGSA